MISAASESAVFTHNVARPDAPQIDVSSITAGSVAANMNLDRSPYADGVIGKFSAGATTVAVVSSCPLPSALLGIGETKKDEAVLTAQSEPVEPELSTFGYKNLGISTVDKLNVREDSDRSAKAVGQMDDGAACEILEFDGEWAKIESGEVTGYVLASYLATGEEARRIANELATDLVTVNADSLRIRSDADSSASVLAKVSSGTTLATPQDADDSNAGWVAVQLEDETTGYVASEYVNIAKGLMTARTIKEIREQTQNVLSSGATSLTAFATQFVGNRYKWGGTSLTNGVDCSGFVMAVYAQYGISLPHSSSAQSGYGKTVSASEAQPGDLFFYGRGGKRIGHVAIYLGNGMIVHAANSRDGIIVSSAYYQTPVTVKRILN